MLTIPAPSKNINTVNAATEEINGQEYAVLDIYNHTTVTEIETFMLNNAYIKYVLQEDITYATANNYSERLLYGPGIGGAGKWVILDLLGHTITCQAPVVTFGMLGEHIELWDTVGTGRIAGNFYVYNRVPNDMHLYIYGGTIDGYLELSTNNGGTTSVAYCEMHGGTIKGSVQTRGNIDIGKLKIFGGSVDLTKVAPNVDVSEVIDGVEYETVYLTSDHATNVTKILERNKVANVNNTGNYRYVMMGDWDAVSGVNITGDPDKDENICLLGNAVIFDLNGYTISTYSKSGGYPYYAQLNFRSLTGELTDTSPAQTGTIVCKNNNCAVASTSRTTKLIISGGNCDGGLFHLYPDLREFIFRGGNFSASNRALISLNNGAQPTVTIMPWVQRTVNKDIITALRTPDYFAVSATPYLSGAYNYEFGTKWEIRAWELARLTLPAEQMSYLWGRKTDGWYEYLEIIYRDGEWVKVDPENSVA